MFIEISTGLRTLEESLTTKLASNVDLSYCERLWCYGRKNESSSITPSDYID